MKTNNDVQIPVDVFNTIQKSYGFSIVSQKPIWSCYGGVFEIFTVDSSYILKISNQPDDHRILHIEAEIAFTKAVADKITEFITQTFVPDNQGNPFHKGHTNAFYLLKKQTIIKTFVPSVSEQQLVGKLMNVFHTRLATFKHIGIAGTTWMREVDDEEYKILSALISEKEFASYVTPLDYEKLNLKKTLIHGDWHGDNMSFSNPPFLFDLDTLSYGLPAEEIARTITHWTNDDLSLLDFYTNILIGYDGLSSYEINIIPHIAVAICYKQAAEVTKNGNIRDGKDFLRLANKVKKIFNC